MKRSNLSHKLAAAATVGMFAGQSSDALAAGATDLTTASKNVVTAVSGTVALISTLAYIAGAGLALAGIFKLKQHVDNPAQAPMKDALIRLACGGMFLSLPFMMRIMQGSISDGDTAKIDVTGMVLESSTGFNVP
ncbi:MAG TPA: hypothetical protein PLW48_05980 [Alphaproteobacteria bacterium]|nr:hypothetical protein [Rhodospirillaceae bacterium]HRI77141.1 hypothetical protein [Alphaproteobacteria bacterium]HRJ66668.1 hypothetical protein [Alphaproteobacteria bacterium]